MVTRSNPRNPFFQSYSVSETHIRRPRSQSVFHIPHRHGSSLPTTSSSVREHGGVDSDVPLQCALDAGRSWSIGLHACRVRAAIDK
jgi:hypothetical protein